MILVPILLSICLLVASLIYTAIYRLYLTPISEIPGPVLAKLTYWYEFYYDVILNGQYTFQIEKLHKKYGPIIRINPHEVHIADSGFADTIYLPTQSSRTIDKFPFAARIFGNEKSFFGTSPHEHHRIRRAPMNRFFTKAAIVKYQDVIKHHIDRMLQIVHTAKLEGSVINLTQLYGGLTADIIGDYAFGEPIGVLDDKQYALNWRMLWVKLIQMAGLAKQYPIVSWILRALPPSIAETMNKDLKIINHWHASLYTRFDARRAEMAQSKETVKVHYTLLDELLFGDLPEDERTSQRLVDEGQSLLGAGYLTTAETLSQLTYHALSDKKMLSRLQVELGPVLSRYPTSQPPWSELEVLPYLSALIKETLRYYYGIIQRTPRIHRDADLKYNRYILPRGTPISTSAYVIHNDRSIFGEDVDDFNPDRWLVGDTQLRAKREKNLFSFGRGTRMCLGYQLAYAELYLTCSAIFNPRSGFKLQLHDTNIEHIKIKHDFFLPYPDLKSDGVKVKVTRHQP